MKAILGLVNGLVTTLNTRGGGGINLSMAITCWGER